MFLLLMLFLSDVDINPHPRFLVVPSNYSCDGKNYNVIASPEESKRPLSGAIQSTY